MKDTWYVLPESLALSDHDVTHTDDGDGSPSFYVQPTAGSVGSVWPAARALPRRARGKLKR